MSDPVAALVAILKADAAVAAKAGPRVFGGELPGAETAHMPRRALVVKPSGGTSLTGRSNVEHDTQRLDLFAFGATQEEAAALMADAALALRRVQRVKRANTLVHWVQSAGGYVAGREPDTAWPRVFQSFQVFHALESIA